MSSPKLLREQRAEHVEAIKALNDTVQLERRDFNPGEQKAWDHHNGEYNRLSVAIRSAEVVEEMDSPIQRGGTMPGRHDVDHAPKGRRTTIDHRGAGNDDVMFTDMATGREIRGVRLGESFRDVLAERNHEFSREPLSVGRAVAGIITGDWRGAEAEKRSVQIESDGTLGGYLLSDEMSSMIIDKARNKSSIMRAGALTIPMNSATLTIARLSGDPSSSWHGESALITSSNATFEQLVMRARTLVCLVPLSIEAAEDSANLPRVVENAMAQSIALEMDRGCLRGNGAAEEPLGLRNETNVTVTDLAGALGWDNVLDARATIEGYNGEPNAMILSSRTHGALRKLKDGNNHYIEPPEGSASLLRLSSNQIPITLGGGSATEAYIGDFRQSVIGIRTRIKLEAFRSGHALVGSTTMDALNRMLIWLRAYVRLDCHVMQPRHHVIYTGITN